VTRKGRWRDSRRVLSVTAAAGLAAVAQLAVATPGWADTVVGCGVSATIDFAPNGPGASNTFSWSLSAPMAACVSNTAGAPTGGVLTVGKALTVSVPITKANGKVVQGTAQYQEPAGSGWATGPTNSCASSEFFVPAAFFSWSDGTVTETNMSMITVGAILEFDGLTTTGGNLPLIPGSESPPGSAPSTFTVFSNNPSIAQDETYSGVAVMTAADAVDCTTAQGLQQASAVGGFQFGEGPNIPKP
jgi:hypothetical protein